MPLVGLHADSLRIRISWCPRQTEPELMRLTVILTVRLALVVLLAAVVNRAAADPTLDATSASAAEAVCRITTHFAGVRL